LYYEIRVAGLLPPDALLDYDRISASVAPVHTLVQGRLPDQAALQGLLARLGALGFEVLEIRRVQEPGPAAG